MLRRLWRLFCVHFSLLSQAEELSKSGFVFVGQAHKSPDASPHWAELWRPSKVGDPFHLLVSIFLPLPQAGWYVPAPWRPPLYCLFVVEGREHPESLTPSRPQTIWQAHPSLLPWLQHLLNGPTPPLDYDILGSVSLLPIHSFLPSFLRVCLSDPGWQLLSLGPGYLAGLCANQKLSRESVRPGQIRKKTEKSLREDKPVGKGTASVGSHSAVYLAMFVNI